MGIFDVFTGDAGKKAANQGYRSQTQGLTKGYDLANQTLTDTNVTGQGYLDQGITPWQTQLNQGNAGVDFYGQLTGLPGAENAPGIQQTLEKIPGYQFSRDQGIEALNRSANSRGMLASGNNTQDILKFSQGLADQNYFDYLKSFAPYFNQQAGAASGIQGGYTNKADLAAGIGGKQADYGWQKYTGIGQAGADRANQVANAETAGSANLWSAILGLGSGLTGAAGKAGGFGNLFS